MSTGFVYSLDDLDDSQSSTPPMPSDGYNPLSIATLPRELSDDPIESTQEPPDTNAFKDSAPTDLSLKPRWPHFATLLKEHPSIVSRLLKSIDDTDAQNELLAKNTENIKGNKWANLQYVTFGGDRGSLNGILPHVAKATELKKNCLKLWICCKENAMDPKIDSGIKQTALRQYEQYLNNKKAVEEEKATAKQRMETLQNEMSGYERQQGALPPGARETGPGRANHSVNLGLGQPSSFAYVSTTGATGTAAVPASSNETTAPTAVAVFTPQRNKDKSKEKSSSSGRSSLTNSTALSDMSKFDENFAKLVDRIPQPPTSATTTKKDESDNSNDGLTKEQIDLKKKLLRQRKREMKKVNEYSSRKLRKKSFMEKKVIISDGGEKQSTRESKIR